MKKIALFICVFTMAFLLTACGDKSVSEDQIYADVESLEVFSNLGVEINDFSIVKRQTSPEDKTDYVYVHVEAANRDISIVRNYMLTYILYNDGWLFEEFESFDNPESPNKTSPLHGVPLAQAHSDMDGLDYEVYRSGFKNLCGIGSFSTAAGSIAEDEYLPIEEDGNCYFETEVQFIYDTFYEDLSIPVTYIFGGGDYSPDGYKWSCLIDGSSIDREIKLHDGILGYWSGGSSWAPSGYLYITSYTETTCEASYYVEKRMDSVLDVTLEINPNYSQKHAEYVGVRLDVISPQFGASDPMAYVSIHLDSQEPETIQVTRDYHSSYWSKS